MWISARYKIALEKQILVFLIYMPYCVLMMSRIPQSPLCFGFKLSAVTKVDIEVICSISIKPFHSGENKKYQNGSNFKRMQGSSVGGMWSSVDGFTVSSASTNLVFKHKRVFLLKLIPVVIKMSTGKRQLLVLRGMCLLLRDRARSSSADSRGTLSLVRHIWVSMKMTAYLSVEEKNREV